MTPFNEELFSTNFELMSIETQFSDSSNETNVHHLLCDGSWTTFLKLCD